MRATATLWTPEKVAKLRVLAATGATDRQIGQVLGCTPDAARRARHRRGVPSSMSPEVRIPADFRRVAEGMTLTAAAKHYGRHRDTIQNWHNECGTEPLPRPIAKPKPKASRPHGGTPWVRATVLIVDGSLAGNAQRDLQRLGPVFRLRTINPKAAADQWSVFGRTMSETDMIALAARKMAA